MSPLEVLYKYWGYSQFRKNQYEIIQSVLEGKDTLALLPTGGGKSICFQVPAIVKDGICVVVSPLIALMKDQVENLQKRGIKAAAIYSGMHYREIQITINNCIHGDTKFLYLSPERLTSNAIREQLTLMQINILAVDEAHCISQWGYDFRPEYRQIAEVKSLLPNTTILALTASATTQVIEDIQTQLAFKTKNVFKNSFERKNLHYIVRYTEQKFEKIIEATTKIKGSGLIYVRSRKKTEEIASQLNQLGIKASFYHAGLQFEQRQQKQNDWIKNKSKIMVCTNAFGMGIDKPDCRLVIHYEMPDNLESYYQEAGRAGRDGKKAFCLLLHNAAIEEQLTERIDTNFPPEKEIRLIYKALCNYYQVPVGNITERSFAFDVNEFSVKYKFKPQKVISAIKILQQLGLIFLSENFFERSKIKIIENHNNVYRFQVENAKFDPVIKVLLRSYGGLFDNYTTINETFIAKKLKITLADLIYIFTQLQKLKIIDFIPQTEAAQFSFTADRVEDNYINFENSLLRTRKQLYVEKLDAILNFTTQHVRCRSRVLLAYFNEVDTIDCGICDICVEKKKELPNNLKLAVLEEKILGFVMFEPKTLHEITDSFKEFKKEEVTFLLRILLDKNKLHLTSNQKFICSIKQK